MKIDIKAIVFDVGSVLALPIDPIKVEKQRKISGVHSIIAKKLGISLDQWFDSIDTTYAKSIEGKISKQKVLEIIAKNNKISKKKLRKIILKTYKSKFKQNKELFKKAFKLRKKGYKIVVLSDQWHFSQEALMPKRLYRKFSEVIVSCEVGMRKPNLKIYNLLLDKLKLKPKQILFIDNQEWNIKPAKKIGIKTILYKNNKSLFKEFEKIGI